MASRPLIAAPESTLGVPAEDYLLPGERVVLKRDSVVCNGRRYSLVVTTKRLLLYRQRPLRGEEVVSQGLRAVQRVRYRECGLLSKVGVVELLGSPRLVLEGPPGEMRELYSKLVALT